MEIDDLHGAVLPGKIIECMDGFFSIVGSEITPGVFHFYNLKKEPLDGPGTGCNGLHVSAIKRIVGVAV